MKYIKTLGLIVYLAFTAFMGFSFMFADYGPGEGVVSRGLTTAAYFLITGFLVGFFIPKRWKVAVFIATGPIFIGIMTLLGGVQYLDTKATIQGIVFTLAYVVAPLVGSYFGYYLKGKRNKIR